MTELLTLKDSFTKEKKEELDIFLRSKRGIILPDFMGQIKVSIILVLYNRVELTYYCIESIIANVHIPYEIIVIDNNSLDDTQKLISKIDRVKYIKNNTNLGFVEACNQGVQESSGEYILFLNNDTYVNAGALYHAVSTFETFNNVGAVGGKLLLLDGTLQEAGSIIWNDGSCLGYGRGEDPIDPEYNFVREVDYCSGAFLMTPRKLFDSLGGFDLAYSPAYYEESDYCTRIRKMGLRIMYNPKIEIQHFEFASSEKSSQAIELQKKNKSFFFARHESFLVKNQLLPDLSNINKARISNNKQNVLIIDDRIPHTTLGAGFPRSNQIINVLASTNLYNLSIYPLNFPNEKLNDKYNDIPDTIELLYDKGRNFLQEFFIHRFDYYDFIWVSRPHNFRFTKDYLPLLSEKVKIIYDAEAIDSNRKIAWAKIFDDNKIDSFIKVKDSELKLSQSANHVIAVTPKEQKEFEPYSQSPVSVLDVSYEEKFYDSQFASRTGILFVGNMDYDDGPNVDSIIWFIDNILPRINLILSDVTLHLIGSCKSELLLNKINKSPSIVCHGVLRNLDSCFKTCKLFIAPTRFCAGSPAKVYLASSYGIPCITSTIIADQVIFEKDKSILAADDPEEYAQLLIKAYTDGNLWKKLRENIIQKFQLRSKNQFEKDLLNIFDQTPVPKGIKEFSKRRLLEQILILKKSNDKLKKQISEGSYYVNHLLQEIKEKNQELERQKKIINSSLPTQLFIWIRSRIKNVQSSKLVKLSFGMIYAFSTNPIKFSSEINRDNWHTLAQALRHETSDEILINMRRKLNNIQ